MVRKLAIIGSGPAGQTAAIYASRACLAPVMFEGSIKPGQIPPLGQLTTTTEVENFPGFESIGGYELMEKMKNQAIKYGTEVISETISKVDFTSHPFKLWVEGKEDQDPYEFESVIIATGAEARRLAVPGADTFWQAGVSACAVCDGALRIFRSKPVYIVGAGDTACEEALFMTKYASKVVMLVRGNRFRASKIMQNKIMNNPKIEIMYNTQVVGCLGDTILTHLKLTRESDEFVVPASGLFFAIGHKCNTSFLSGVDVDDDGYIIVKPGSTQTSVPGVFACGDCADKKYRQAITSCGSGCMASLEVEHYLNTL